MLEIYRKLRPGEPPTVEAAETLMNNLFFDPDVYKRQGGKRLLPEREQALSYPDDDSELRKEMFRFFPDPVSYTHLDVYKRQRLASSMASTAAPST